MSSSELTVLLAKYGMTFHWGVFDKMWWIIGQVENGCNQNTVPILAENYDTAQVAALQYIQRKYRLSQYKVDSPIKPF